MGEWVGEWWVNAVSATEAIFTAGMSGNVVGLSNSLWCI